MSATIAAIANLKGGVGKSTTTLMLADGLAYYYGADVLVVDLDPQANSSQMLLTDRGLQMAFEQGKGVHHLIKQFSDNKPPNLANLILPNAVTLEELRRAEERDERMGWISILPAHTQLRLTEMELEEKLYTKGMAPSRLASYLAGHMEKALEPLSNLYDVILIDTPPVLLVPDARVIGQHADAILYTVHWDKTPRQQVIAGLRSFQTVGLCVTGMVLSKVNPSLQKSYGHDHGLDSKGYYHN